MVARLKTLYGHRAAMRTPVSDLAVLRFECNYLLVTPNISATNTGNVYLYAKWRYDQGNAGRIGTYTITDADRFTQSYDQISVALSSYNDLVNIGMEYLAITLKINMWEVNDGYQYIFIYDGSGSGATLLWEQHAPSPIVIM